MGLELFAVSRCVVARGRVVGRVGTSRPRSGRPPSQESAKPAGRGSLLQRLIGWSRGRDDPGDAEASAVGRRELVFLRPVTVVNELLFGLDQPEQAKNFTD